MLSFIDLLLFLLLQILLEVSLFCLFSSIKMVLIRRNFSSIWMILFSLVPLLCFTISSYLLSVLRFLMSNLGPLSYFRASQWSGEMIILFLSKWKYTYNILTRPFMSNCKPISTLVKVCSKLIIIDEHAISDPTLYRKLISALQYLTFSRIDISCVVEKIYLFIQNPCEPRFQAFKRIIQYVSGTLNYGLQLKPYSCMAFEAHREVDAGGWLS